jgi:hypothetical protein
MIKLLILALVVVATVSQTDEDWANYKERFGKVYSTA